MHRKYQQLKKYFLLGIFIVTALSCNTAAPSKTITVHLGDSAFLVEVAATPQQHSRGLMYRTKLKPNKGMLFTFSHEDFYSFWMKNMRIPIDIIWINKNKRIVFIKENVQPCAQNSCPRIRPQEKSFYVLEVKAGTVKRTSLTIGDPVRFPHDFS